MLDGDFGPCANDELLAAYLNSLGLGCARRDLLACVARLDAAGLVRTERRGELTIVGLTQTGSEVARGISKVDGVAVPFADCPY